jgi:tetratricopeptide (TPR) repeat protein
MLADGEATVSAAHRTAAAPAIAAARQATPPATREAEFAFARAESLYGAGSDSAAAVAYQEALNHAPPGWPHYARAVESLLFALDSRGASEPEARLAREAFPRLRRTASAGNVAASGLEATLAMPASSPDRDTLRRELERDAETIVKDRSVPLAADDRSSVYIALLDARKDAGDSTGARRVAGDWSAFLDGEAARARSPEARVVFDSHRLAAYLELEQPERAVPMLERSERDFPDDYNPPARLAVAYRAMKRWNDGLAASDRALKKAYGPRTLGMYQVRTDLYLGLRDTTQARHTLEDAVRTAEAFPPGQRSERAIAGLRKKLEALR